MAPPLGPLQWILPVQRLLVAYSFDAVSSDTLHSPWQLIDLILHHLLIFLHFIAETFHQQLSGNHHPCSHRPTPEWCEYLAHSSAIGLAPDSAQFNPYQRELVS